MLKSIIFLFIATSAFCQQYDSVHIEKSKVDLDNLIYTVDRTYVFEYEVIINDTIRVLSNSTGNDFVLRLVGNDSILEQEIPLAIIKPKLFKRSNKKQTQALYTFIVDSITYEEYTGIVENDINTWVHPPRFGFFKSLETCPFPYINQKIPLGESWNDKMLIGDHYSNELWGVWNGNLLLNYEYTFTDIDTINTNLGQLECQVIKALATSTIGTSALTSYYSSTYGFVKLEYILFNGIKINLYLKKVVDSKE